MLGNGDVALRDTAGHGPEGAWMGPTLTAFSALEKSTDGTLASQLGRASNGSFCDHTFFAALGCQPGKAPEGRDIGCETRAGEVPYRYYDCAISQSQCNYLQPVRCTGHVI